MLWFAGAVAAVLLIAAAAEYLVALHEFSIHKRLPLHARFRQPHVGHPR